MNNYIYSDVSDGITSIKVGLMNALKDIKDKKTKSIIFEKHIPMSLVMECCRLFGIPEVCLNEFLSKWTIDYENIHITGIYKTGYLKLEHD